MVRAILAVVAAILLAGPAAAQPRGMTLAEVASALSEAGVSVSEAGERLIGETAGIRYELEAYNCQTGRCTEFLFTAGFTLGAPFPLARINAWNWERVGGRASLDGDGDPYIDHLFSVSGPGDRAVVREAAALWEGVLLDFADYIGLQGAGA